jgi:hypothetical protein
VGLRQRMRKRWAEQRGEIGYVENLLRGSFVTNLGAAARGRKKKRKKKKKGARAAQWIILYYDDWITLRSIIIYLDLKLNSILKIFFV